MPYKCSFALKKITFCDKMQKTGTYKMCQALAQERNSILRKSRISAVKKTIIIVAIIALLVCIPYIYFVSRISSDLMAAKSNIPPITLRILRLWAGSMFSIALGK